MKIYKKVALAIMVTSIFFLTSTAGHSAEKTKELKNIEQSIAY